MEERENILIPSEETAVASGGKGSGKKITVILLLLAIVGAGAFVLLRKRHVAGVPAPAKPKIKAVMHLESFVLNLASPEQGPYLRVGIDLGLEHDSKEGEKKDNSSASTALVRDTILGVLTIAKPDELVTPEGKAKLKQELVRALQERAPEIGVREVYFTEFLIQN